MLSFSSSKFVVGNSPMTSPTTDFGRLRHAWHLEFTWLDGSIWPVALRCHVDHCFVCCWITFRGWVHSRLAQPHSYHANMRAWAWMWSLAFGICLGLPTRPKRRWVQAGSGVRIPYCQAHCPSVFGPLQERTPKSQTLTTIIGLIGSLRRVPSLKIRCLIHFLQQWEVPFRR